MPAGLSARTGEADETRRVAVAPDRRSQDAPMKMPGRDVSSVFHRIGAGLGAGARGRAASADARLDPSDRRW
jgi:hypothetical protein